MQQLVANEVAGLSEAEWSDLSAQLGDADPKVRLGRAAVAILRKHAGGNSAPADMQAATARFAATFASNLKERLEDLRRSGIVAMAGEAVERVQEVLRLGASLYGAARALGNAGASAGALVDHLARALSGSSEGAAATHPLLSGGFFVDLLSGRADPSVVVRPPAGSDLLRSRYECVTAHAKALEGVTEGFEHCRLAYQVAEKLGVLKGDAGRVVRDALHVGHSALSGLARAAQGGFIDTAFSALGTLFGGGPDPAEERHAELMARLGAMDAKLDGIAKNVALLLERQSLVLSALKEHQRSITQQFQQLNAQLYRISDDVAQIQIQGLAERLEGLKEGETFVEERRRRTTYAEIAAHFRENSKSYWRVMRSLLGKVGDDRRGESIDSAPQAVDPLFKHEAWLVTADSTRVRREAHDAFRWGYDWTVVPEFRESYLNKARPRARFAEVSLLRSSRFPREELAWMAGDGEKHWHDRSPGRFVESAAFTSFLSAYTLDRIGMLACELVPYLELVDQNEGLSLLEPEKLLAGGADHPSRRDLRDKGRRMLIVLRHLCDASLAQHRLLAGHLTLPSWSAQLRNALAARARGAGAEAMSSAWNVGRVLESNALLRRNLLVDLIRAHLEVSRAPADAYARAWTGSDGPAIARVVPAHWNPVRARTEGADRDAWCLAIAAAGYDRAVEANATRELRIPLPAPGEVREGGFRETDDSELVRRLRERVEGLLRGYELYDADPARARVQRAALVERSVATQ